LADYPSAIPKLRSYGDTYTERSLLYAENLDNIAIHGRGTIDGQGAAFRGEYKVRPFLIRMIDCRDVSIRDIRLRDAAMWALHLLACDDVVIDGVSLRSRVNPNNDGIDVDSCRRVRISNCEISTIDDSIVLKSCTGRPCQEIVVTNCVLSTDCSALKLGTESNGGFENIAFSNCTIYDTRGTGIAVLQVDGGLLERLAISNITMKNVAIPIFIRLGDRGRPFIAGAPRPGVGDMRNVRIANVEAVGSGANGCFISGIPGRSIERLSLDGIRISFAGGGSSADAARAVPELPDAYPVVDRFGVMPAYGLFCRHVSNLTLRDVALRAERPEPRPALVCDDVDGLALHGGEFAATGQSGPSVLLRDVREAIVEGCRASAEASAFVGVSGSRSARISIIGNHLARASRAVEAAAGVPADALFLAANRE
ncbi:MAG: glycosyl hydrolase family 28 protein, partial [Bryobacteraceae bacterium]